jgi:hypothetical protein
MPVAKLWNGSQWVIAIVGAKGDPGISIDEGSGFNDGDILRYDAILDVWYPDDPTAILG